MARGFSPRSPGQKVFLIFLIYCIVLLCALELIVVGGDLNGHGGTNVDRYDGVHGGHGFGERNADGEQILEFCDAMELIVTNTCLKRQKNKLATYVSGGTVLRRCDQQIIKKT